MCIFNAIISFSVEVAGIACLTTFLSAVIWLRRQHSIKLGNQVTGYLNERVLITDDEYLMIIC